MVNIEYISGQGTFKFNGETRVRNYHSQISGDKVRIVNAYDTDDWLLQYTLYTDISLNGTVYGSAFELAEVLAPVLFQKAGGTDGGTTSISGNIITKTIPVEVDWTQNSAQQIVDFVNGQAFSVLGTQRILFKAVRIIGDISTSNAAEFHFWEFKPGKGSYGVGGTAITSADLEYISFVTNYQNNVINLGEIGTTPIEVYINDNGPFGINTAALNVFKSTREGIAVNYIYVGTATSIGLGATQTTSSDYIDVNATPVNPPSSTGGLDVPQEYGLIPMSLADGSIEWVPIPTGGGTSTSPTELISITTNWQQGTLDYKPYAEWRDNGVVKSFSGDRTADPADPTHARYDLWYIDLTTETVEIKKGTASANPERPSVDDPVNHLDTGIFIHILAGATTPEGVNGEVVYAENAPGEYAITAPGSVNVASTDTPHSGSVNIEVADGQFLNQSQSIVFTPPAPLTPEGKELAYWIKNKTGGIHHWTFVGPSVKNGRTTSVVVASPGNYDPNSTAWQAQSIPFPTDLTEITSFRIVADFTGFSFHLDDISVISGGGVVVIGGDYADKRLSNLASDLSEAEKTAIKNKLGVSESPTTGGDGTVISSIIPITENYLLTPSTNNAIIRAKNYASIIVPSGLGLKHRTIIKKATGKAVSLTRGENVVFEVPAGHLAQILAQNDAIEIVCEEITNGVEYWGVYGALVQSEFELPLGIDVAQTSITSGSLIFPGIYKSSDFPEITTTKDYFVLYSSDHGTVASGACYWGEIDDPECTNFVERGILVQGNQAETPFLVRRPVADGGKGLYLFYHSQGEGSISQETRLKTTPGGAALHLCTWTDEGFPLGVVGGSGEDHTGYAKIHKRSDGTYVAHHLTGNDNQTGLYNTGGISTSTDLLTWTRVTSDFDQTQGCPPNYTLGWRVRIFPFVHNGTNYAVSHIYGTAGDGSAPAKLIFSEADQYFMPINQPLKDIQLMDQPYDGPGYLQGNILYFFHYLTGSDGTGGADTGLAFVYKVDLNNLLP